MLLVKAMAGLVIVEAAPVATDVLTPQRAAAFVVFRLPLSLAQR